MNVLVACEESQVVCKAFRAKCHNAFSCDIQDCSGGHPEWHIKGDVLKVLNPYFSESDLSYGVHFTTMDGIPHFIHGKWDLIIAHPPCTFMSKAGARWMYPRAGEIDEERLLKALAARFFFMTIWNADCPRIVIENPVPLKIVDLPPCSQKVQPYHFGHGFSKCTCLWEKGVPPLVPTNVILDFVPYLPSNTGAFSRGKGGSKGVVHNAKDASKTFPGIAAAMAEQWG